MKNLKFNSKKILSLILALGFSFLPINSSYSKKKNKSVDKRIVSIFDERNIASSQYGADQCVFKTNFNQLIQNPYIWNEMQKYFPEENFTSKDEAIAFYRSYFNIIYDCGCGYAVATDAIFEYFRGHEKEFEEVFGYPMYTINSDGFIDFNYEVLMLEFFNYSVLKISNSYEDIIKVTKKDMYEYELDAYTNSEEFLREEPENMTDKELEEWNAFDEARRKKFFDLYNKWISATKVNMNFGISVDEDFGYLYYFMLSHRFAAEAIIEEDCKEFAVGDIIATGGFHLYEDENDKSQYTGFDYEINKIGDHYLYVTDITDDGKIIVSSWGQKYILDLNGAYWKDKVLIKLEKPINY